MKYTYKNYLIIMYKLSVEGKLLKFSDEIISIQNEKALFDDMIDRYITFANINNYRINIYDLSIIGQFVEKQKIAFINEKGRLFTL